MNDNKKWDVVLMNPPYDRSLHLKFLEKTIKISDTVISIQPVRWIQDPNVKTNKKKYVESIGKHIKELETFDQDTAAKLFKARLSFDLGIYLCKYDNKDSKFNIDDYCATVDNINIKDILEKIKNKTNKTIDDVTELHKNDGWRSRVDFIRPLPTFDPRSGKDYDPEPGWKGAFKYVFKHSYIFYDGKRDGKWWSEFGNKNQFSKNPGDPIPLSIKFNSEEEANNFEKSLSTKFMQFIKRAYQRDVHVPLAKIPFMEDYKKPWTDERFKEYFNLTTEDWNKIEKVMKRYYV